MSKKSPVKEEKVRVKWSDLLESPGMPDFIKGPEQSKLMDRLFPHYQTYISPVNPIFLSMVTSLEMLNGKRVWMARDGLVPLLFFFAKFKTPKGFTSKILLHEDVLDCVPVAWRPFIGSYYLQSQKMPETIDRAFVYGVNSEAFISGSSVEQGLKSFERTGKPWKEVWLYLSMRQFSPKENPRHHAKMSLEIFKRVGFDVKIVDLEEILGVQDWTGWELFELHKKTIIADGWMSQALLGRGIHIPKREQKSDTEVVHLSASHDCVIQWDIQWPREIVQERQNEIRELIQGIEAQTFDWRKILSEVQTPRRTVVSK